MLQTDPYLNFPNERRRFSKVNSPQTVDEADGPAVDRFSEDDIGIFTFPLPGSS